MSKNTLGFLVSLIILAAGSYGLGFSASRNQASTGARHVLQDTEIIWTVSGPFESREQQGSGKYFLLDHPTEGRRMVKVAQVTGVTITQIPSAVVEMGISFEEEGDTHYRTILWSKE